MATIVLGSYMVRYPLAGMMSWVLQYLVGFDRLGHDVYFVESAPWANACFDPARSVMTDDPSEGIRLTSELLARFGLADRWCFVDCAGSHYGMTATAIDEVLNRADLYIDMGVHGTWSERASGATRSLLIDGEPGFTQMKMVLRAGTDLELPPYDFYYTTGRSVGTEASTAPAAGKAWRPIFHPVVVDMFEVTPVQPGAAVTTIMNWQTYDPIEFEGAVYGHKDVEFEKFMELPSQVATPLEIAVSGHDVPFDRLHRHGWRTADAQTVTRTFDDFVGYIRDSSAEFSVCKSAYVTTRSGWFSDRSAAYLASARPVVQQDTGFGDHLPTGTGVFAAATVTEAAEALAQIADDPVRHSAAARDVAGDCLDASVVLRSLLTEVGV